MVAVLVGWITTEVGRHSWTIHGLLRTADSVSSLAAPAVAALPSTALIHVGVTVLVVLNALRLFAVRGRWSRAFHAADGRCVDVQTPGRLARMLLS